MATATDLVREYTAIYDSHTGEYPPGSNHNWITQWFGFDGAWCAMTASYVLWRLGLGRYRSAAARGLADQFRREGRFHPGHAGVKVGDLVFFDWSGRANFDNIHHVEGCVGVDAAGWPLDIGGNVSDTVVKQYRRSCIAGYATPPYTAGPPPKLTSAQKAVIWLSTLAKTRDWARLELGPHSHGPHVHDRTAQVQQLLHMFEPGLYPTAESRDGVYGGNLVMHVLHFQKAWNAYHPRARIRYVDGHVRRRTIRALLYTALTRDR